MESLISRAERTRAFPTAAGKSASWSDTSQAAAEPTSLSGSGVVSLLQDEYVGYNTGSIGTFQQTSGSNNADGLFIGTGGRYTLGGGTLQINAVQSVVTPYGTFETDGFVNKGVFDGGSSPATLLASNCTLDLTSGTWQDMGLTTVIMGSNSLLMSAPGF